MLHFVWGSPDQRIRSHGGSAKETTPSSAWADVCPSASGEGHKFSLTKAERAADTLHVPIGFDRYRAAELHGTRNNVASRCFFPLQES